MADQAGHDDDVLARELLAAFRDADDEGAREIVSAIPSLSRPHLRRLLEYADALRTLIQEVPGHGSWLAGDEFRAELRSRIAAHHALNSSPIGGTEFEDGFIAAALAEGFEVERAPAGERFWDVRLTRRAGEGHRIREKKLSLKTTAALSLQADFLHVSKLTEAAWIQDVRGPTDRRNHTLELFDDYRAAVDSIIQFRFFRESRCYELVEVEAELLSPVSDLPLDLFKPDGPVLRLPDEKEPDLIVRLDRSDAKITLAKIRKSRCTVHCTWTLEGR